MIRSRAHVGLRLALGLLLAFQVSTAAAAASDIRRGGATGQTERARQWREVGQWPNLWEGVWQLVTDPGDAGMPAPDLAPAVQAAIARAKADLEPLPPAARSPAAMGGGDCTAVIGMPLMMGLGGMPIKFFPAPDLIAVYVEHGRGVRFLHLGGRADDPPGPSYYGRSTARWDGAVLVVETDGLKEAVVPLQQWRSDVQAPSAEDIQRLGPMVWPAGPSLRVVERMSLDRPDVLTIQTSFFDNTVYSQPYTITRRYQRYTGNLNAPQEWVCIPSAS